jgi:haloalkane dehalogenase
MTGGSGRPPAPGTTPETWAGRKRHRDVLDLDMAWVEEGSGDPVVFLHGNPTSSFLWRNVLPALAGEARCLAPDLPGMGDSAGIPGTDPDRYSFHVHQRYLDALLDALVPAGRVTLVLHDWGSALGFHWARRHPERVRGIAYMEALVRPLAWDEWPARSRSLFQALRSPAGESLILERNVFIERILPCSILRPLTEAEMAEYRRPFTTPGEGRRVMLAWPRALPLEGDPGDVVAIVAAYAAWLAESPVPKLFINAEPGAILTGPARETCRRWPHQREVTVPGSHFIQEDSAPLIGAALADWYRGLPA